MCVLRLRRAYGLLAFGSVRVGLGRILERRVPTVRLPLPPATLIIVEPLVLSFLIVSYSVLVRARVWGNSGWKIVFPGVRLITDVGIG